MPQATPEAVRLAFQARTQIMLHFSTGCQKKDTDAANYPQLKGYRYSVLATFIYK